MNSIETLLEAAEYIDRREREAKAEHGYASTIRFPDDIRHGMKRPKTRKSQGNRTSHNELEKNRRAHLRKCLENLKDIVPLGPEASRHTTLGLLTKAKRFIKNLEDKERKHASYKDQLCREQRFLRRRVESLHLQLSQMSSKRRSMSECSTSTISSTFSLTSHSSGPSPISESDEVDVIGYTSTQSDTDDHYSVFSGSSDSGVAMSTSRLTLSEMDVL